MTAFFDTSALAKRYWNEPGSGRVRWLLRRTRPPIVSRLAIAELCAAMARRAREGYVRRPRYERLLAQVRADESGFLVVDVGAAVTSLVPRLVDEHPLRGADAVHLATALWLADLGSPPTFVCADQRLIDAAAARGLDVLDPTK